MSGNLFFHEKIEIHESLFFFFSFFNCLVRLKAAAAGIDEEEKKRMRKGRKKKHVFKRGGKLSDIKVEEGTSLVEARLLHDAEKFLLVNFTIIITVSFVNHFLKFFICQILPKFFGNSFQIFE